MLLIARGSELRGGSTSVHPRLLRLSDWDFVLRASMIVLLWTFSR